jgi:hypothetical protein
MWHDYLVQIIHHRDAKASRRPKEMNTVMDKGGDKLAALEDGAASDDGDLAFTVKTTSGKAMRVHCPLAELGDIFAFLGQLAKAGGEMRNVPMPSAPQTQNYLAPIPSKGIAFQAGTHPGETLIVMRLTGFDMAFAVPSKGLVTLADDIRRIALTLSSGGGDHQ